MDQAGLVAARAAVMAALLAAAGLPLYLLAVGRIAAAGRRVRQAIAACAVLAGLGTGWWLLAVIAVMADLPLGGLDRETVSMVAAATPLGLVVTVRLAALALLALAALLRLPLALCAAAGLVALATAAFTGHAGAGEGMAGLIHRAADTVHLAAAACWLGALFTFVGGAFGSEATGPLEARLARFAGAGTVTVGLLTVTGAANTLLIAGWPLPLRAPWFTLLAAKLALFAAMLGLAALNRWRLTPALARGEPGARGWLRLSLACETACALGIVALVAALGTMDPAGA